MLAIKVWIPAFVFLEIIWGVPLRVWTNLSISDRTPLDCYQEVEEFKAHTRRLEREFVVRTVGRDFPAGH
jgi:hypothetical protein